MDAFITHQPDKTKKWQSCDLGKQQAMTHALVSFVVENLQPVSIVESPDFCNLIAVAEPRYTMPSRKHLSTTLLQERHDQVRAEMVKQLAGSAQVCLTMDIWTNRQMRAYLGVTAHYIDNFVLKNLMLVCRRIYGTHSGENIIRIYDGIVQSFGIKDKVSCVITDNASNMLKAFRLLDLLDATSEQGLSDDDDDDDDNFEPVKIDDMNLQPVHLTCIAHTIQLIVGDGLRHAEHMNRVLAKISRLVSHVRHSTHASELLEGEVRLQIANATRWNSQLTMIESLLKVSPETMKKIDFSGKLNSHEENIAKDLLEILAPFKWATDMTQGQEKVTAGVVMPVIRGLKAALQELASKYQCKMVTTLKHSVDTRLSKYETEIFKMAAALDPRWKLTWCDAGEDRELRDLVHTKLRERSSVEPTTDSASSSPPRKRSRYLSFLKETPKAPEPTSAIDSMVKEYFDSPCVAEDADPLAFWKAHQSSAMAQRACCYLQIPASSAAVERLFSIAGKVFRPDRSRLTDQRFEQLMFIRSNQKLVN